MPRKKKKATGRGGPDRGQGRKPKYAGDKTRKVSLSLPDGLASMLDEWATQRDKSRSEAATAAIRLFLGV